MPDNNIVKIEYKGLDENSKMVLKRECINTIRKLSRTTWIDVCLNKIETLFTCSCSCRTSFNWFEEDEPTFIENVLNVLRSKSKTKKMFYHKIDEEQSLVIAKGIHRKIAIDYNNINVYLLAGALKDYCTLYLGYYLPKDIHFSLLRVYQGKDRSSQKEVIKRVPFIMSSQVRTFFKGMFGLFRDISDHQDESETSLDNLLDLFGPLVIKIPENYVSFNAFTKREVLKDLMKADFDYFTVDLLQKRNV